MATYAAYRHIELDNVGYGKKRVLKPPGGGSSDIFGGNQDESPRRVKNHTQSQIGTHLFGGIGSGASTGSSSPETPRSNKPGNDSHNRLFGPPAPKIQNKTNHMRSNISLSGDSIDSDFNPRTNKTNMSNGALNGGNALINDNANTNDNTGRLSCMPRNPVTGDGIIITPCRRSTRKCRDGNPVTGTGYISDQQNNFVSQNGSNSGSVNGDSKSSTDSSPGSNKPARTRVPPGGFSSGLW